MDWQTALSSLEFRLRTWVRQQVLNVVDFAPGSVSTSDGTDDAVAGLPADEESQTTIRRVQLAGFRSRFVKTVGNVIVKQGTRWFSVAEDDGFDPSLAEGEAIFYAPGKTTARIKIDKDGAITATNASGGSVLLDKDGNVTVNAATGKDVTVNGGTHAIGRVGDSVKVTIPTNALILAVSGASATGPAAPLDVTGTITAGAAHFKG